MIRPLLLAFVLCIAASAAAQRAQSFDSDPHWDALNNRLVPEPAPMTRQSFGYRDSKHAGGGAGEIGGWVCRSTTLASYAKPIPPRTLNDKFSASGKFAVTDDKGGSGVLFGWFNANSRGWRTPNSIVFRLDGNGGKYWVFFEYGTQNRKTGGGDTFEGDRYQTTTTKPFLADGTVHQWTMSYDPAGAAGRGEVTLVLDGNAFTCPLAEGHKQDGATFDRFGIMNTQTTGNAIDTYFDDIVIDGQPENFDADPHWEARGNEVEFPDRVRRPFHDFGYSATNHAGGKASGEMGGVIWRGGKLAYYADGIGAFSLDHPLHAAGKVAVTGAAADSAAFIGFFDAKSQKDAEALPETNHTPNQLGIIIEGPSRIGHYFRPAAFDRRADGVANDVGPVIAPDGKPHTWSLDYDPKGAGGVGQITVKFDDQMQTLDLKPDVRRNGATFDHFGLFNMHTGGHFVEVWLDDLQYTAKESEHP
jgi:hypothetical protein